MGMMRIGAVAIVLICVMEINADSLLDHRTSLLNRLQKPLRGSPYPSLSSAVRFRVAPSSRTREAIITAAEKKDEDTLEGIARIVGVQKRDLLLGGGAVLGGLALPDGRKSKDQEAKKKKEEEKKKEELKKK